MTTKELNMEKYTLVYRIGEMWYYLQFDDLKQIEKFVRNPQINEWHLAEKPKLKS